MDIRMANKLASEDKKRSINPVGHIICGAAIR